jgi:hypothetical protein
MAHWFVKVQVIQSPKFTHLTQGSVSVCQRLALICTMTRASGRLVVQEDLAAVLLPRSQRSVVQVGSYRRKR